MQVDINSKLKLNNGIEIPRLGLGTYNITRKKDVDRAIHSALEAGYRLIDTAAAYYNEREIGEAIKSSTVTREEIFITTKLDNSDHGYKSTFRAFEQSLSRLDTDYVDLYLIHWPISRRRNESWKAMEELLEKGKCKAIGVSNYMINHLEDLKKNSSVLPAVNQIEFNPFVFEREVKEYCQNLGVAVEAYTPIARGRKFKHQDIKRLSDKYGKTEAQVMLRWGIQHNVIVIPKSSSPERIKENADIFNFNISDEDMGVMNSLDEDLRYSPDPHNYD
ncbi:MAG: glyoxal reductase [Ignavibacteria bacterium GWA2_35_9]|nr:MAG: glyoxal reductase [Ignavibacteria bacterium GWA2_35_9]OGU50175.1 MAG: glyoxal reductase [Ignavibacteria bacterium GWC2_36_12]